MKIYTYLLSLLCISSSMSLKAPLIMDEWEGWGDGRSRETPADRFASRITHLPDALRRRAWGHFEQQDLVRNGITFQEAERLATLYTDQYAESKKTEQDDPSKK